MIVYDLVCSCGSQFEGWFKGRNDFEEQNRKNLIGCPICDGFEISKILSPVAIKVSKSSNVLPANIDNHDIQKTATEVLRVLHDYVKKNFEDVGPKLAEESLKIHYGVEKSRNIRGVATAQEEKMLKEAGVDLVKIPLPVDEPDDKSN